MLRRLGIEARHRCLHAVRFRNEVAEVELLLFPVTRPRLDDIELPPEAELVAHRHQQSCREGRGEEIALRSEEHTSELQSLMRISYAVFCLKKKQQDQQKT